MGNIFAILAGENNSIPPIGMGSHLDSQPAGGRFDGCLGVVAALQVLRTVKEVGIRTYAPLAAVLTTTTSSTNTVPGSAFCTLDLRDSSEHVLDRIETELHDFLVLLEKERPGISVSMNRTWRKKSVRFDAVTRECVRYAAVSTVGEPMVDDLESYAGHDSAETAHVIPTAMIFVPSRGGVSHNPAEFTSE